MELHIKVKGMSQQNEWHNNFQTLSFFHKSLHFVVSNSARLILKLIFMSFIDYIPPVIQRAMCLLQESNSVWEKTLSSGTLA